MDRTWSNMWPKNVSIPGPSRPPHVPAPGGSRGASTTVFGVTEPAPEFRVKALLLEGIMLEKQSGGKPANKVALITGADKGIGREVALLFAREGADIAFFYLNRSNEAAITAVQQVEKLGRRCIAMPGDIGSEDVCRTCVEKTVAGLGRLDVLVNNAGTQRPKQSILQLEAEDIEWTFRTNIYGYIFMAKHALRHMKPGATVINTASITAYAGARMAVWLSQGPGYDEGGLRMTTTDPRSLPFVGTPIVFFRRV